MYNNGSTTMPIEAKENDLLESDRLKAVTNLQKYQDETRSWRDLKVKKREFDVDNLVLLQSPQMESSDVTPTFCRNKTFCANRSTYKIIVLVKNFPKINLA
jgi:hypothetical protein